MFRHLLLLVVALPALVLAGVAADVDGDGRSTAEELRSGTAVLAPDTDGDDLEDGDEAARRTAPLSTDTDVDGLGDRAERDSGTDPLLADPDGDGLDDGREADLGTEATAADTDGDGLSNDRELGGATDPRDADTDADGLADGRELNIGTDPLAGDSDDDGLEDGIEADLGTDPLEPDTDGDGFPDGTEVDRTDVLPGADPLRVDVYVEVDLVAGARLPRAEVERVVDEFADAPVGQQGARGIALHVVYDETDLEERGPVSVADRRNADGERATRIGEYQADHYDYRGYGYHYLLVAPEVQDVRGHEVIGEAGDGELLVQSVRREGVRGSTFMHELGHSLGLDRRDFDGIDSEEYSAEEYPSVMNYNTGTRYYGYSADEPFDDWAAIVEDLYVPDASRFEEDAGETEDDA